MFDRLVDFIISIIHLFFFTKIIESYQSGVRVTLGRPGKILGPGIHLHWPLKIGRIYVENVMLETLKIGTQYLTTKDDKEMVISTVVSFKIIDVRTFLLEIEGRNQFVEDIAYGTISEFVTKKSWQELMESNIARELSKSLRADAKKYGVEITRVQIKDFAKCMAIRLIGGEGFQLEKLPRE